MKNCFLLFFALTNMLLSLPNNKPDDKLLTNPTKEFDIQKNTVCNVDFITTNYGCFGFNSYECKGGVIWPRNSLNQYIFGGGFWFGAQKFVVNKGEYKKLVEKSYNVNNGRSWFIPGLIQDGDSYQPGNIQKYKCYFSTDYNTYNGKDLNSQSNPNWPLWINDSLYRYHYGTIRNEFVSENDSRNLTDHPNGPLIVSDEDIISVFKDTDLNYFDMGPIYRKAEGYPLRLQIEQRIYTWGIGYMKDVIFISYSIHNLSNDTLRDCWFAPVHEIDIARAPNLSEGASNDRLNYYSEDSTLNLIYAWSNGDKGEAGNGFGYLGISFIETPSVDINRMIRKDKFIFEPTEQIGLKTFNNWNCYKAYDYSAECYDFISKGIIEQDNGLGCKKVLIATGPFNMLPGDEARIVVGLVFAAPAKGGEPDGTFEDLTGLKRSVDKNGNPQMLASIGSLISNLNMARETYYPELASKVNDSHSSSENMLSISPNPVSNSANLRFNLKDAGLTKISIVNQFGQEINVIYNNWLDAGEHNINLSFEKNTYSDGIYFIRLTSGNSTQTKKFAIVR